MLEVNLRSTQEITRLPFDEPIGWKADEVALYALSAPIGGKGGEVASFFVGSKSSEATGEGATVLYAAEEDGTLLPGPMGGIYPPVPFAHGDETVSIADLIEAVGFRDVTEG